MNVGCAMDYGVEPKTSGIEQSQPRQGKRTIAIALRNERNRQKNKRKRREEKSALLYIPLESRSPDSGSAAPPASDAFRRNPDSAAGICGRAPQAEEEKTTDLPNPSPSYDQREEEERRRRMEGEEKGARVLGFGLPFFFVFFFSFLRRACVCGAV